MVKKLLRFGNRTAYDRDSTNQTSLLRPWAERNLIRTIAQLSPAGFNGGKLDSIRKHANLTHLVQLLKPPVLTSNEPEANDILMQVKRGTEITSSVKLSGNISTCRTSISDEKVKIDLTPRTNYKDSLT